MYKLCKTEESASRQRLLEQGLLQAMRVQQYEQISVSDLCDRMDIPRKSFYRYFSSKDGALFALIDHTLMEFVQSPHMNGKQKIGSAVGDLERFFVFWYEKRDLLEALQRSRLSGLLVERATNHALNERMMPIYLHNAPLNVQSMTLTFCICGLLAMVLSWHENGYRQSAVAMAQIATQMLSRPLIPTYDN